VVAGCGGNDSAKSTKLAAPTGAKLSGDFGGTGSATLIAANTLPEIETTLRDASSLAARITYTSTSGINNKYWSVTASLFVPRGNPPPDGWITVALGHPTTGILPECAPSLTNNLLGLSDTVAKLLQAGFVVTVPDYQGLGSDEINHPYLDSTTVGFNMIDSVRAAHKVVHNMSNRWLALGVEQGGQAAWAANELAQDLSGGFRLLGSISISPFSDLEGLADAAVNGTLTRDQELMYQAYLAAMENSYDKFDAELFRRGVVKDKGNVLASCRPSEDKERQAAADQITPDDLRPANPDAEATLRGFLQKSSLPQGVASAPMWVIYGDNDPLVPQQWTEKALTRACALGDTIRIDLVPGPARAIDVGRIVEWARARFNGETPVNNCSRFIEGVQSGQDGQ
jgi:pimeloyl-ACP methyl ester carboxylesterase